MNFWIDWDFIRVNLFLVVVIWLITYSTFKYKEYKKLQVPDYTAYKSHDRIVCAAAKLGKVVVISLSHFDPITHETLRVRSAVYPDENWHNSIQGFVNNKGEFLTREEAYWVAKNANQIVRRVGGDYQRLFSENLY